MNRTLIALLIVAGLAGVASPGHATSTSCAFGGLAPHLVDPAMVGVDQTAPNLPEPMVADIRRLGDGREEGGCDGAPLCKLVAVRLTNLATDDMTPVDRIGYRITIIAGSGFEPPTGPIEPGFGDLYLFISSSTDDIDFTLEVVAIDLAGNESAPRTVRVHQEAGGCSVGRGRRGSISALAIVALVLAAGVAAGRQRGLPTNITFRS